MNAVLCSSYLLASLLSVCSPCVCARSCVLGIPAVHRALVHLFPECIPLAPSISHLPFISFTCLRWTLLLSTSIAGDRGDSGAETFHGVCIHGAMPLGAAASLFAGISPRECCLQRPLHFSAAPSANANFCSPHGLRHVASIRKSGDPFLGRFGPFQRVGKVKFSSLRHLAESEQLLQLLLLESFAFAQRRMNHRRSVVELSPRLITIPNINAQLPPTLF